MHTVNPYPNDAYPLPRLQLVRIVLIGIWTLDGKLEKIKDNVWKLEKDGNRFSVKRYHSQLHRNESANDVHEALHSVSFPHIVACCACRKIG